VSWLRYSDDFTEWAEWDHTPLSARWAYVCLIQACSRGKYWDGRLPKKKATAALMAQVHDPQKAIEQLEAVGLAHDHHDQLVVVLPRIEDHIPPAYIRENADKSKIRMRRKRAHDAGRHQECLPDSCPDAPSVTQIVTRNTGTGRGYVVTSPSKTKSAGEDDEVVAS
jgi:hypothetical protein